MIFAVIPCRQASKRFRDKPIKLIDGVPMFRMVYRNIVDCPWVDGVVAAFPLNDVGLRWNAERYKVPYVQTYEEHVCGSDRVFEAVRRLGVKKGLVLNIQGDEPLLTHGHVKKLIDLFEDPKVQVGTLVYREDGNDEDDVGVYFDGTMRVFDFRRGEAHYKQIGAIGFRLGVLGDFSRINPGKREKEERVELLRCIENGIPVHCVLAEKTIAVDRPADIAKVEGVLRGN